MIMISHQVIWIWKNEGTTGRNPMVRMILFRVFYFFYFSAFFSRVYPIFPIFRQVMTSPNHMTHQYVNDPSRFSRSVALGHRSYQQLSRASASITGFRWLDHLCMVLHVCSFVPPSINQSTTEMLVGGLEHFYFPIYWEQ